MTLFYLIEMTPDGEILASMDASLDQPSDAMALRGGVIQEIPHTLSNPGDYYWDTVTETLELKGLQPTKYHVFNYVTHLWEAPQSIEQLKADKKAAVEAEFVRRVYAPITYDSKLLDADFNSQFNLSSKIAELAARDTGTPLPVDQLIWRDANNITHTFADLATYRAWLNGLVIAISERATVSYMWSWQKKADLDLLTTYDDIVAFDPII